MKGRRSNPERIIPKLREAEVELAKDHSVTEVAKKLGISKQTYYRWRKEYGPLTMAQPSVSVSRTGVAAAFVPRHDPAVMMKPLRPGRRCVYAWAIAAAAIGAGGAVSQEMTDSTRQRESNGTGGTQMKPPGVLGRLRYTKGRAGLDEAPKLILNSDCSNFFVTHGPEEMTLEGVQSFVDDFVGTQVAYLFINPNAQRTVYRSKVWDSYLDVDIGKLPEPLREANQRLCQRYQLLERRGLDPIAVWVARCREKGISPWLTMRMNDLHTVHLPDSPLNSRFWREHPEYWRVPSSINDDHFTADRCAERAFDFAHPEVRAYHMRLIREFLERYDVDGIDLDWMRFWAHFAPGRERQGCAILNDVMADVRRLTDEWSRRRGHAVKVCARVPSHPQNARGLGLDGVAWAKQGLVDWLVPTPFWFTSNPDIPIELWLELMGPASKKIVLAGGIELRLHTNRVLPGPTYNDIEGARGEIVSVLDRGAQHVYLFNFFFPTPAPGPIWTPAQFREFLKDGAVLDKVLAKPRRHIVTFDDALPPGVPVACLLPARLEGTRPAEFRIYTGPAPRSGRAVIRAGLSGKPGLDAAQIKARINGHPCEAVKAQGLPQGELSVCDEFKIKRELHFPVAPKNMNHGYNLVELMLAKPAEPQEIVWVEIRIEPKQGA